MDLCTLVDGRMAREEWTGEFDRACDVAVVGLGTAGALAVIAAAREGVNVLGVEALGFMGGIGTGGAINWYYWGTRGGLQDEVDAKCREFAPEYGPRTQKAQRWFHPEVKKYVLEDMATDAGAKLLYHTKVCGVFRDAGKVVGLQAITADGITNIGCRVLVDASGDAHACAMAGCGFRLGRAFDGLPQPYSAPRARLAADGSVGHANFDAGYVDPCDPADLSRAICHGQTLHLRDRYEDEPSRLLCLAPLLGLREGRLIECEETITFEDVLNEVPRERVVMQMYSHHDIHSRDWAFESDLARAWTTVCDLLLRPLVAQVPHGVIVPKGLDGLLVSGRCISLDHDSAQSFRMQPDMQKLGEIAGVAAAIAAKRGCATADVPYPALKAKLEATGCLPSEPLAWEPWPTEPAEIRDGLASDAPGVAIWSCRRLGNGIQDKLLAWLTEEGDANLRRHSAFALGLLRNPAALPVLRETVSDTSHPDSRKAQPRSHAAMFLLGVFADREAVGMLGAVLDASHTRFGDFTHAARALLRIGAAHPDLRERIGATLEARLAAPDLAFELPLQGSQGSGGSHVVADLTEHVRTCLRRELAGWAGAQSPGTSRAAVP